MTARTKHGVDFMSEGEILVRGTRDPHEALKVLFDSDEACEEWRIEERLAGVARPRAEYDDPPMDLAAVDDFAGWLNRLLSDARCGYYRKVNCLESSYGAGENWAWALHRADEPGRGAFEAVEFS